MKTGFLASRDESRVKTAETTSTSLQTYFDTFHAETEILNIHSKVIEPRVLQIIFQISKIDREKYLARFGIF